MKWFSIFAAFVLSNPLMADLSEQEAKDIAVQAYIYGYPLMTMDTTRQVMTNVAAPNHSHAPMGQFANSRHYPDPSFHDVTAPNADTLYSTAWVDLSKEPYILHVPDEHGRYYLMPLLSGWTDVFEDPGTRTTGTKAANFAITGPYWEGKLPPHVKELKSPTNMIWILGRTYSSGTAEDFRIVHGLQDQYSLTPLSHFGKPYTPPSGWVNPDVDMKTPVRDQVNQMNIEKYLNRLALLMKDNPPTPDDAAIVEKMAKLGIVPGQSFDINKLDPKIANSLQDVPKLALQKVLEHQKTATKVINGWNFDLNTGIYGTDYLQRALVTFIGLGANRPQDAVYPYTTVDTDNQSLNGKNRYVIHFPKGQTPPAKGFWSLTMYNNQYFFVPNPLNRYTLSTRDSFKYNADGSLDLYIQNENPGKEKESNWLPAPQDDFVLMLRIYWPEDSLLQGAWKPPGVEKVK